MSNLNACPIWFRHKPILILYLLTSLSALSSLSDIFLTQNNVTFNNFQWRSLLCHAQVTRHFDLLFHAPKYTLFTITIQVTFQVDA